MTDTIAAIERTEEISEKTALEEAARTGAEPVVGVTIPLMQTIRIPVDSVSVGGARETDQQAVEDLKKSMPNIGLKTPITIRVRKTVLSPERIFTERFLVAGFHRLEAAKRLGLTEIDAFVLEGDETDARLWEIAENLHRKQLNSLQRSDAIDEWIRLAKQRFGQDVHKPQGGRPEGGNAEAARQLPVPGKTEEGKRKTIERALKINQISREAKEAATAAGFADNQSALIAIARETTISAQLKKVAELAGRKRTKRKKSRSAKSKAPPITPPAEPEPFRSKEEKLEQLRQHAVGIGHDIDPRDLIVAPGSTSADARPCNYAIVRIPHSHPDRDKLMQIISDFRGDPYNTTVFYKILPQQPRDQDDENHDDDREAGDAD